MNSRRVYAAAYLAFSWLTWQQIVNWVAVFAATNIAALSILNLVVP